MSSSHPIPERGIDARKLAERVLLRVFRDGAFASASLDAEIEKHPQLSDRDRALATELVYGTLRTFGSILKEIERFAPRGLDHKDPVFLVPLVLGAYQVLLLDKIPAFAAVNAAVGRISEQRGKGLAGFANALLRKLKAGALSRADAIYGNVPSWLRQELEASIGLDQARSLVGAGNDGANDRAQTCIHLKPGADLPTELTFAEASTLVPGAYRLQHLGDPRKLDAYRRGAFTVQEEGAQLLACALGAQPGDRIWDACAGRGQKAALLAHQIGVGGQLWVSDLHPKKISALRQEFARLDLPAPHTEAIDLSLGTGSIPEGLDRILVDAPCSGTGTLRRRPEILLRLEPEDPARLATLSEQILRTIVSRLRPEGRVVFAVCSVLTRESENVIERVTDLFQPVPFDSPEVKKVFGEVTQFRLLPGIHGTDGYFAASLQRRS